MRCGLFSPNNEDGRVKLRPLHHTDLEDSDPPQNQTACRKAYDHMQGRCLGREISPAKNDVMKAAGSRIWGK